VQPAVYNSESSRLVPAPTQPESAGLQPLIVPTIATPSQPAPHAQGSIRGDAMQAQVIETATKDQSSPLKYYATKWRRLDGGIDAPASPGPVLGARLEAKVLGGSSGYILMDAEEPETPVAPAKIFTKAVTQIQTVEHREVLATEHASGATDGTVFFDDTERVVAPTITPKAQAAVSERAVAPTLQPARMSLPERLQQLIAKTCNKPVQDVHVTVLSAGKLAVRIKASAAPECESLSKRIFEIPELTPFQVSLEIPVTH
jgi:hypothetical protein